MNFVNAPLDQVLAYLSDAAGFIIVQQARVSGYVTIQGAHITKDEAVNLLNRELNQNNYAAILDGRMLTIMNKSDARTSRIPVKIGNDPTSVPNNDEIATWIVPIRFVEARQLVSDLSLFVSPQATIVANEAGNSIVVTDTQANIRHLVQIIQLVDNSAEAETEIRVFPLKYASPVDVANELSSVFPSSSSSDSQSPVTFGGPPGSPGGGFTPFSGNDGTTTSSSQQRIQKATQVTTVADSRIQAVIVTAPKNLMNEIAGIMTSLDVPSDRDQQVAIIQLQNSDPLQVAQVLQSMFSSGSTSSTGTSSQSSALQTRQQQAVSTMSQTTTSSSIGSSSSSSGGGSRTGAAF
jgi:type II secretory pathway component GspD/PulD (secretin)